MVTIKDMCVTYVVSHACYLSYNQKCFKYAYMDTEKALFLREVFQLA